MAPKKKTAAAQKAKPKAPAKKTKAGNSRTVKGNTVSYKAKKGQDLRNDPEVKKAIPPKPANRPVNIHDLPLHKLVTWLTKGMLVVRERLDAELPAMLDAKRPASELAHLFGMVRDMSTITGEALEPLGKANSLLANVLIPKAFELENLTSFTTQDGYRVTVSVAYRASIKGDMKMEAYQWLRDNGLSDIITETVNAGTLGAAGKAMVEEKGILLPEELFNAAFVPGTSLTKVPKK